MLKFTFFDRAGNMGPGGYINSMLSVQKLLEEKNIAYPPEATLDQLLACAMNAGVEIVPLNEDDIDKMTKHNDYRIVSLDKADIDKMTKRNDYEVVLLD